MSNAKIQGVKGHTSDGKLLVELEYSPEVVKKDELIFFKINFFDSDSNDRTRHVDCDLIVRKSGMGLFKASKQYSEPLIHSPNGILLTSFGFNETGRYTLSIEVGGLNFFPIKPLFVDFLLPLVRCQMGVLDPYCQLNKSRYQVQIHVIHISIYHAFSRGVPMNLNLFKS